MLETLRQGATGWIAKILIGLLILSFAVWGVADVFTNFGANTLIKVGDRKVSVPQYQQMFNRELNQLSIALRRDIDARLGRQLGVDQQILQNLLVDEHAGALGIGISDLAIAESLHKQPAFQDDKGGFDKASFAEYLRGTRTTEQEFLFWQKKETEREQILDTITEVPATPKILLDAVNTYQFQQRTIDYIVVPDDKAGVIADPDEAKLSAFYDSRKDDFMAPEFRRLALLVASPADIKAKIEIKDDDLKARYEAIKASYATPEKRRVQQITFTDKAAADKARIALEGGKDFGAVAKDAGQSETDIDRGLVTKEGLLDKKAAEAAFALTLGAISPVVEGDLALSISRVTEIVAATQKTFDEVKSEIRDALALQAAGKKLLELRDQVEDLRAAGTTLKEAAPQLGLKFVEIEAVDRTGKGRDGKDITNLPGPEVVKLAFESDVGVETDPLDLGDNGYVWVDVIEVVPTRQKTLEEVREEAKAAYLASERAKAAGDLSRKLTERLNKGEDIKTMAKELGLEAKSSKPITRAGNEDQLSEAAARLVFATVSGGSGSAPTEDGTARLIFKLTGITPPKPLDEAVKKSLMARLGSEAATDARSQYAAALQDTIGLDVNQALYEQITALGGG